MRIITLLLYLFSIGNLTAQNVVEIAWEKDIKTAVASPTIEIGDTINWIWSDDSEKSVTSMADGDFAFDSEVISGLNANFSYTFNRAGVIEYYNQLDPSMQGKITVVSKLSSEDKFVKNLNFFPNPVKTVLNISSVVSIDNYQIFNVLGSLVAEGSLAGKRVTIDMSKLNSGLYFINIRTKNTQTAIKVAKK